MKILIWILTLACLTWIGFTLSGCATGKGSSPPGPPTLAHRHGKRGHGPPPHAPAHGYRAKFDYYYYPDVFVYFDPSRRLYFYLEGDNWHVAASLPTYLRVRLGGYVTIQLDTDTPYVYFDEHRSNYPPGKWKGRKGGRKKGPN